MRDLSKIYGPTLKCKNPSCNNEAGYKSNGSKRTFCSKNCHMQYQWNDPTFASMVASNSSERMTKLHQDEEFAKSHSLRRSKQFTEMNLKNWEDPEYRDYMTGVIRENIKKSPIGTFGWHDSPKAGHIYYRSTWELKAYKYLDSSPEVKSYSTESIRIPYHTVGREHNYYPDIVVEYVDESKEVVEIKPEYRLSEVDTQLKILAGVKWSLENNTPFSVWTENNWPCPFGKFIPYREDWGDFQQPLIVDASGNWTTEE